MRTKSKTEKYCPKCKTIKKNKEFTERTGKQIGMLSSYCKHCMNARQGEWRLKNMEKFNTYQREYRRTHPIIE